MAEEGVKRKLTTIFSADAKGLRLFGVFQWREVEL